MHLLHPAHQPGADRRGRGKAGDSRRRSRAGLRAGLPRGCHCFWRYLPSDEQSRRRAQGPAKLRAARGVEYASAHDLPGQGHQSQPGDARMSMEAVNERISAIVVKRPLHLGWLLGFVGAFSLLMLFNLSIGWLLFRGVGIWGVNVPVAWGFAIVNFVWWIGIGHAGTFISAILLLLHQQWRTSINRFAEAMTLFAVACAGLFPLLHLGRPWFFYWLFPYPNTMHIWPQFRSPLVWDVFAVLTYFTVSLLFWYVGLLPDLATLRDRSTTRLGRITYGFLAMGWRGSARHWR